MYGHVSRVVELLRACRVPDSVPDQEFGLWAIFRQVFDDPITRAVVGFPSMTVLTQWTESTMQNGHGHVVMEDSRRELSRHLPILLAARGRVLVCGLGLGCVVRGLMSKPEVEHIDVVELDREIFLRIGTSLPCDRIEVGRNMIRLDDRVTIHNADALTWDFQGQPRWDFAWHDVCTPDDVGLQPLHMQLMKRFWGHVDRQGAWDFPREASRIANVRFIGAPRTPRNKRRPAHGRI